MSLPLFEHLDEVDRQLRAAPAVLLCAGFDGTLVPLMDSPNQVILPAAVHDLLRGLLACQEHDRPEHRVVPFVISGRALAGLRQRVGVPGLILGGNHGLEIEGPGFSFIEPRAEECRPALRQLVKTLASRLAGLKGARVEDKGLTASVHYRQVAPDHQEEVRRQVHAVLAGSDHPFVLASGHKVFEIRPRVYWTKGNAVRWVAEQLGLSDALIVYLGDDITDEDAFAVLAEGITIKVGDPTQTTTRYYVSDPAAAQQFLAWLARRCA
jgi:trehalose-phosphatase